MCRFVPLGAVQGAGTQSSPKALKGGPLARGETLKRARVEPRGHRNVAEQLLLRRSAPTLSDPELGRSHAITLCSGDTRHLVDEGNWPKKKKKNVGGRKPRLEKPPEEEAFPSRNRLLFEVWGCWGWELGCSVGSGNQAACGGLAVLV